MSNTHAGRGHERRGSVLGRSAWALTRILNVPALTAVAFLVSAVGACHADIIVNTTPLSAPTLPLPNLTSVFSFVVTDPNTGVPITFMTDVRVDVNSVTDQIVRGVTTTDWEAVGITFGDSNVYTGLTVENVPTRGALFPGDINILVNVNGLDFHLSTPMNTPVTIITTDGDFLHTVGISTPGIAPGIGIGAGVGPFELYTAPLIGAVPEPSTLICSLTAGVTILGYAWGRRKRAVPKASPRSFSITQPPCAGGPPQ